MIAVRCLLSAVCCLLSAVCCLLSTRSQHTWWYQRALVEVRGPHGSPDCSSHPTTQCQMHFAHNHLCNNNNNNSTVLPRMLLVRLFNSCLHDPDYKTYKDLWSSTIPIWIRQIMQQKARKAMSAICWFASYQHSHYALLSEMQCKLSEHSF